MGSEAVTNSSTSHPNKPDRFPGMADPTIPLSDNTLPHPHSTGFPFWAFPTGLRQTWPPLVVFVRQGWHEEDGRARSETTQEHPKMLTLVSRRPRIV